MKRPKMMKIDYHEFKHPYKCSLCDKLPFDKCRNCNTPFCRVHTVENLSSPKYNTSCIDCMIQTRDNLQSEIDVLLSLKENIVNEEFDTMDLNPN